MTSKELDIIFAECETFCRMDLKLYFVSSWPHDESSLLLKFWGEDSIELEFVYSLSEKELYYVVDHNMVTEDIATININRS